MVQRRTGGLAAVLISVALSGCGAAPPPEPPRLPRIESYVPSEWDREQLQRQLNESARAAGLENPPPVEVVAWQNPDPEDAAVVACLERAGVAVLRTGQGYGLGGEADRQRALAHYTCTAQYPVRRDIDRPVSTDEATLLHRHLVERFLPCAEKKLGHSLSRPSRDDYEKALRGASPDPVMTELTRTYHLKDAEFQTLLEECQLRPSWFRDYER